MYLQHGTISASDLEESAWSVLTGLNEFSDFQWCLQLFQASKNVFVWPFIRKVIILIILLSKVKVAVFISKYTETKHLATVLIASFKKCQVVLSVYPTTHWESSNSHLLVCSNITKQQNGCYIQIRICNQLIASDPFLSNILQSVYPQQL